MRLVPILFACLVGWNSSVASAAGEISAECRAFRADLDANIGEIMRAGCEPTTGQMSKLMDNPIGNVAMWLNQVDLYSLTNDEFDKDRNEYQSNYMGIVQIPTSISKNWSIVHRVVYNIPSVPISQSKLDDAGSPPTFEPPGGGPAQPPSTGPTPAIDRFSGRTSGFGDMYYVGLLSPKVSPKLGDGRVIWALGLDQAFPSASDDILGGGKWSAGPAALGGYLGAKVKVAFLVQNYFSYAGDKARDDIRLMNLQYLYYYSLNEVTSIGAGPNIIANWEASKGNKWTVPIGIGINRTFQLGKLPVRFGVEWFYNVVRPDSVGANWDMRFMVIPAIPAALFKWTGL
jgi:hypothetical protein